MDSITIKLSDKIGSVAVDLSVTKEVKPGIDSNKFFSDEFDALVAQLKDKKQVLLGLNKDKTAAMSGDTPKCPKCKATMKISKTGKRWVCTLAKFRKINGEFVNQGCEGYIDR